MSGKVSVPTPAHQKSYAVNLSGTFLGETRAGRSRCITSFLSEERVKTIRMIGGGCSTVDSNKLMANGSMSSKMESRIFLMDLSFFIWIRIAVIVCRESTLPE